MTCKFIFKINNLLISPILGLFLIDSFNLDANPKQGKAELTSDCKVFFPE